MTSTLHELLGFLFSLRPSITALCAHAGVSEAGVGRRGPVRVKAKKGVNLLETKSRNAQWQVGWEMQSGAKHSITTIDVSKNKAAKQGEVLGNVEVMQLDFEMENFTSLSVTRRINWNIDYKGQSPPPESEKVVTELTVVQRDIQAIIPLAM
ncbi:hypothetical protein KUCAC02_035359, partial [Chaenocephalus aceratus]